MFELVQNGCQTKGFGLSSIPQPRDDVPIQRVPDRTQLSPAIRTTAEDFDPPNHMLDQDPDLGFARVAEFLVLGEWMIAFGFLIDATVPDRLILRERFVGTIRPDSHVAHKPQQFSHRARHAPVFEDPEVMHGATDS